MVNRNIMLDTLKPIILNDELDTMNKCFNEETMSIPQFIMQVNALIIKINGLKTWEEAIFFIMEFTDVVKEEASQYLSNLYFEKTLMYN